LLVADTPSVLFHCLFEFVAVLRNAVHDEGVTDAIASERRIAIIARGGELPVNRHG